MKNANQWDVLYAKQGQWKYAGNCMFLVKHPWFGDIRCHYRTTLKDVVPNIVMETAQGSLIVCEIDWVCAVPRKQGTPAKAKRRPLPGKKPWLGQKQYVPYDAKLIAPGVKVLVRNGKEYVITDEIHDFGENVYLFSSFNLATGKNKWHDCHDIMKIIVEPKQDKHNQYEKGVWHFWDGKSSKPPVDGDVKVQYWMRSDEQFDNCAFDPAKNLRWKWDNVISDGDIIAFRIV